MAANLLELIDRCVHEAENKFDLEATKLGEPADTIRKSVYAISALYSLTHQVMEHEEPDEEGTFRDRILRQTFGDFHAMMASYSQRRPSCSRCDGGPLIFPWDLRVPPVNLQL